MIWQKCPAYPPKETLRPKIRIIRQATGTNCKATWSNCGTTLLHCKMTLFDCKVTLLDSKTILQNRKIIWKALKMSGIDKKPAPSASPAGFGAAANAGQPATAPFRCGQSD
jgi:hypothetical protein